MRRGASGPRSGVVTLPLIAALLMSLVAACTGAEPHQPTITDKPGSGGTVRILTYQKQLPLLDPQRDYTTAGWNMSQLITRTLTAFKPAPGKKGAQLEGDLATDTGHHNADSTVWTYTLRSGVKWQTGDLLNCEDIRYGVLRNFDSRNKKPVVHGGPPYATEWLDVPATYKGPRTDADKDSSVTGVKCVNDKTIQFRLKKPEANFPYAVAMTSFAPVREKDDSWGDYATEPMSTGPYKLAKYTPAKGDTVGKAVFERNRYWDGKTDPVRTGSADKIVVELGIDIDSAAQQLTTGNPDYDNAVMLDQVPANFVSQVVNDKQLRTQTIHGPTSATTYMSISTKTVPKVKCRQALEYGFNKRKFLEVLGGKDLGDYATSILPPADPAHRDFDIYGTEGKPDGDLDKAQQLLDDTKGCPAKLTLDVEDSERGKEMAKTIVDTYARLGITVKTNKISGDYYDKLNYLKNSHDLTIAGWASDWPGGSGTIPALFDGHLIKDGANSNYAQLDDKGIDSDIAAASRENSPDAAAKLWGDLDERIQKAAAVVPILYPRVLSLCGPKVRGAFLNAQVGAVNIASLGVE
ncbi:MAG TPA: ABC transporter substrate-binding protein [Stackebrandtia sp.]|jgi:peptide/nickel transport system substrate-binding protein|uniref:ABC transporter substrate-binding protein n=1 Tax=Stackebrandtia sp. TaxID=2023065 RepID=UPI002D68DB00|nr:ABC transporter substrate-binding protein [Stackebrandtia sp.]HZE41710.1 ABC transporter substrate-binding protein [Stackebrandtia sp.]